MKAKYNLSQFSELELCSIYNNLNFWNWDSRLGKKPKRWDKMYNFKYKFYQKIIPIKTKSCFISPILKEIRQIVSEKELLRYHHINNLGKTDYEFEIWWQSGIHSQIMDMQK